MYHGDDERFLDKIMWDNYIFSGYNAKCESGIVLFYIDTSLVVFHNHSVIHRHVHIHTNTHTYPYLRATEAGLEIKACNVFDATTQ